MAYTTACTTVQAVIIFIANIRTEKTRESKKFLH